MHIISTDNNSPRYWNDWPTPSEIQYKGYRFLITNRPSNHSIPFYVRELKRHGVTVVVRVCESSYHINELLAAGIEVVDMNFDDGSFPPEEIIDRWFQLLRDKFSDNNACVAVHCISGLGRAPVMVILALLELGVKYEDAVKGIRSCRRGALNTKQLRSLLKYHPNSRLSRKRTRRPGCSIM